MKSRRKGRLIVCMSFLLVLSVWVGLSPRFSPSLYESELFHPDQGHGSISELRSFDRVENRELFFVAKNGERLHGWMFIQPGSQKIVLLHPGNAGDIAKHLPIIEMLLDSGASVFIYEPRGFGMSGGNPSIKGICEDGESAFDYLVSKGYREEQIVLYGESLGASVATHVSSVRPAAGIILQSGFASLERIGKEKVPVLRAYPSFLFPVPRLDNASIMEGKHQQLLILHGEKDTLIDISHSDEIFARASGPKKFVRFPDSGHSVFNGRDRGLFVESVRDFLSTLP